MRSPRATLPMARWLVLTLAAVGLLVLVPASTGQAPAFAATRWVLALHPVQAVAAAMMLLAWLLLVNEVARLPGPWRHDRAALSLALLAALSAAGCGVAVALGGPEARAATLGLAIALHVALCLRIDVAARAPARTRRLRGRRPAPG